MEVAVSRCRGSYWQTALRVAESPSIFKEERIQWDYDQWKLPAANSVSHFDTLMSRHRETDLPLDVIEILEEHYEELLVGVFKFC